MGGRLQGRTALITGSSSGLGAAIALAYAEEGANVCCVDLYPAPRTRPEAGKSEDYTNRNTHLPATHELIEQRYGKDRSRFLKTDMTKAEDVEKAVTMCAQTFGRLDIMVNNAGITTDSGITRLHQTEESDFDKTIAINTKGVFLGCKYALRQFLEQTPLAEGADRGWIVNMGSIQGLVGVRNSPTYNPSKHAVVGLTKQVAVDYAADRIRCNAVCPGFTKTAMTQDLQNNPQTLAMLNMMHPLKGMGEAEDIAAAAVFLASDDAKWITGVALPVDGGYVMQ